jgi:uncharacterized repeat protein (TIGR02543 family)
MKKGVFAILAILSVFAIVMTGCPDGGGKTDNTISVTFNSDGGSAVDKITDLESGDKIKKPADPTKDGYTFGGWYKEKALTNPWNFYSDTVTGKITLYAKWIPNKPVTLDNVEANGSSGVTTTQLTLTFSEAIEGLSEDDITLKGVDNVIKGPLSGAGPVYTLPISFGAAGTLSVDAVKKGYTIKGGPKDVQIYINNADMAFYAADSIKELTRDGSNNNPVQIDTNTGIIYRDALDGWGSWFSIAIPSELLPVLPGDTIKVTYLASSAAAFELFVKKANSTDDTTQTNYSLTFNPGTTPGTHSIQAKIYGDTMPSVITFQSKPPPKAWKLKITKIEITRGAPVKITSPVAGLKPVDGAVPVTSVETGQFTGTVSWKDASNNAVTGNFAQGAAYTATITLTKKTGYTFEGIAADSFPVPGADTVTNALGTAGDTLEVTAVFPATAAAAPDKTITFTPGDLTVIKGITADEVTANGFTITTTTGYGSVGNYAYIEVDFGTYKLGDYKKVDLTFEQVSGDMGYKMARVWAFDTAPTGSIADSGINQLGKTANNSSDGIGPKTDTISFIADSSIDKKVVYIAFSLWTASGAKFTISDIKFYN